MSRKQREGPVASGSTATLRRSPNRLLVAAAAIVAATLIAYATALSAGFVWDDDDYVTENVALHSLDGLRRIWLEPGAVPQYYPLTFTSFWVEYHLWGAAPFGYHLVNVLLHALNALLFWQLLRLLGVPGAWLAAAVFALHPMHVESVAWITERKNVLSGALYLGAALAYLRFSPPRPGARPAGRSWYLLAVALFVAAVLSKSVACSLPAALLLVLWWKRGGVDRRDLVALAPLILFGLAAAATTAWMERHHVGAEGAEWQLGLLERCLVAGRALWFYVWTLAWPQGLTFIYPRWRIDAGAWWQYLFPGAALAVIAAAWANRRRGRAPLVALLFFAGTLVPALGFFQVYPMRYSFVADHFAYLASLGLIALASAGVAHWPKAVYAVGLPVLVVLGVLTSARARVYENLDRLWTDTLARNPGCWMAHNNLGVLALSRGDNAEAVGRFEAALAIRPEYAEAHNNLGNGLRALGRPEEALPHYREALRLEPGYAGALANQGVALAALGRTDEGLAQIEAALRLQPRSADSRYNLGTVLLQSGRAVEAAEQLAIAIEIAPERAQAHGSLGVALAAQGRVDDAVAQLARAVELAPTSADAHYNLASVLLRQGRVDDADRHFAAALRLAPQRADVELNFALALADQGRVDDAMPHFAAAIALRPEDAEARYNLATVLLARGRTAEAAEQFNDALRLAPDHVEAHNNFAALLLGDGRVDEAVHHYREAVRLRSDDPELHTNLGVALEAQTRIDEAVAEYQAALRLRPDDAVAQENLGRARNRLAGDRGR